jgi:hypothetical protein
MLELNFVSPNEPQTGQAKRFVAFDKVNRANSLKIKRDMFVWLRWDANRVRHLCIDFYCFVSCRICRPTNLLEIVDRDLKDAESNISSDWQFGIAYNAALKLCTILLHASGYRREQKLGHYRTMK